MNKYFSIEWLKLRKYRTFYIVLAMFLFLAPLTYYIFYEVILAKEGASMLFTNENSFGAIWYNVAYTYSNFVIFLSLLMTIICTNEFQYKTHRQNVIDGWKRSDFYNAKWLVALLLAVGVTLFAILTGLVVGAVRGADFGFVSKGLYNVGSFFLLSLNYIGFGLAIGMLVRRTGIAVIIVLAYYLFLDNILHSLFMHQFHFLWADLLLPMESSDQLMPIPQLNKLMGGADMPAYKQLPIWSYAVASLGWVVVYYSIVRYQMQRSDW